MSHVRVWGWSLALGLMVLLLGQGCGVPWQVVKESGPPSALKGAREVAVEFEFADTFVGEKPLQQYIADREAEEPGYQATFDELVGKLEAAFVEGFAARWSAVRHVAAGSETGDAVVAKVKIRYMQFGKYFVVGSIASQVRAAVEWFVGGDSTDEITIQQAVSPGITNPSVFQHYGPIGNDLGSFSAQFLQSKQEE